MTLRRILVPVDFSECSHDVLREAIELGGPHGAELVLLHVVELPAGFGPDMPFRPEADGPEFRLADYVKRETEGYLDVYDEVVDEAGAHARKLVLIGPVVDTILSAAEELDVDLIVMGTHGRRGFHRWMLGSVAEVLSRRATRPVTTVRTEHKPHCQAGSCATCQSGVTPTEHLLRREMEG